MRCDLAALDVFSLDDRESLEATEVGQQVRCRLFQRDPDGRRLGRRDPRDGAELVGVRQLLIDDPAVRVHDVVRGERAAVVECHTGAQTKRPLELVGAHDPRLGERRPHLQVFVGFDERVEDVLEHLEREVRTRLLRIELIGLTRDRCNEVSGGITPEVDPIAV